MKKYLSINLIILLCSCELVVDIDIPIERPSLVVNALFNTDSVWTAKVSLNRHILDQASFVPVNNAKLVIFDGNNAVDTLTYDTLGFYRSDKANALEEKVYTLKATAEGYNEVTATSSCPAKVPAVFSAIETTTGEFGETIYNFSITIDDPSGENFYQVGATFEYRYTNPQTGNGFVQINNVDVRSDDKGIDDENIPNFEGFFFSDALFDGSKFTVNIKMISRWGSADDLKFNIYLRTLSEEYYRYKTTSLLQNYASDNPFAQPVTVYNNIENGFGIFAGYTQQVVFFKP